MAKCYNTFWKCNETERKSKGFILIQAKPHIVDIIFNQENKLIVHGCNIIMIVVLGSWYIQRTA